LGEAHALLLRQRGFHLVNIGENELSKVPPPLRSEANDVNFTITERQKKRAQIPLPRCILGRNRESKRGFPGEVEVVVVHF
jgi:hypothetical protein